MVDCSGNYITVKKAQCIAAVEKRRGIKKPLKTAVSRGLV